MKSEAHSITRERKHNNNDILKIDPSFDIPPWLGVETIARFVYENMKPYEDALEDTRRGLKYALSPESEDDCFVLVAMSERRLLGVVVVLNTGIGGFIPTNLLLFAAVEASIRNQGVGELLITEAIRRTGGDIKVHCEYGNPALRLYERLGFKSKYAELRFNREAPSRTACSLI